MQTPTGRSPADTSAIETSTTTTGTPNRSMLTSQPPRAYTEWTVRGTGESTVLFVTFSEADARRAHAKWLDHGEPVELVKREVTTWTEVRYAPYEVITDAT